jgi:hypothetical protein
MMRFIARRTCRAAKPTGFKLCIGHPWEWFAIVSDAGDRHRRTSSSSMVPGAAQRRFQVSDRSGAPLQEGHLLLVHN